MNYLNYWEFKSESLTDKHLLLKSSKHTCLSYTEYRAHVQKLYQLSVKFSWNSQLEFFRRIKVSFLQFLPDLKTSTHRLPMTSRRAPASMTAKITTVESTVNVPTPWSTTRCPSTPAYRWFSSIMVSAPISQISLKKWTAKPLSRDLNWRTGVAISTRSWKQEIKKVVIFQKPVWIKK